MTQGQVLGANLFAYCSNNPVMRSDPNGMLTYVLTDGKRTLIAGFPEVWVSPIGKTETSLYTTYTLSVYWNGKRYNGYGYSGIIYTRDAFLVKANKVLKNSIICSNVKLKRSQMLANAQYIANYFLRLGWTKQAISGMIGNMETESYMNPGVWQGLKEDSSRKKGFGLVQWTPASKYIDWATNKGLDYMDIDIQLERIVQEYNRKYIQWIAKSKYGGMSFKEYSISHDSPEFLAIVFCDSYERPGNPKYTERANNAKYWYNALSWI